MKTVVTGCSWAWKNFYNKKGIPMVMWYEHLAKQYGWDIITVAAPSGPNDWMVDEAMKLIYSEGNIERCVIALSDWGNVKLPDGDLSFPAGLLTWDNYDNVKPNIQNQVDFYKLFPFDHKMQVERVRDIWFRLFTFIELCVSKNVEVVIFEMHDCIKLIKHYHSNEEDYNKLKDIFINDFYAKKVKQANSIDGVKIIGWPFLPEEGGFSMKAHLEKTLGQLGYIDHHPDFTGQKFIAETFHRLYL